MERARLPVQQRGLRRVRVLRLIHRLSWQLLRQLALHPLQPQRAR